MCICQFQSPNLSPPHSTDALKGDSVNSGLPCGSAGKESTCNAGDLGSIPELGRSPGGGHGNPLQDSCLKNPMDRGDWQAMIHRIAKRQT